MVSSVAAACSSKLKERQKRLRSASPQARLTRLPKGEWMTSCMPPASSKKRSNTTVCCVGSATLGKVVDELHRGGRGDPRLAHQPVGGGLDALLEVRFELTAQPRHTRRELVGP